MLKATEDQEYYELASPTLLPKASGFLWNESMMIHVNCRGYTVAQFMQPEPAKYSHEPNLEAKTFMQPEQPYYAHHPGRFVYVKDEETGEIFSAPYEPVRVPADQYTFAVGKSRIVWKVEFAGIALEMSLTLPKEEPLEPVAHPSEKPLAGQAQAEHLSLFYGRLYVVDEPVGGV